jgi:hypothetical protein
MMSSADPTSSPAAAADPTLSTGFDVALLLEALAQVECARVASETVLEANTQVGVAAA